MPVILVLAFPSVALGQYSHLPPSPSGCKPEAREHLEFAYKIVQEQKPSDFYARDLVILAGFLSPFDKDKTIKVLEIADKNMSEGSCLPDRIKEARENRKGRRLDVPGVDLYLFMAEVAVGIDKNLARSYLNKATTCIDEKEPTDKILAEIARVGLLLLDGEKKKAMELTGKIAPERDRIGYRKSPVSRCELLATFTSHFDPDVGIEYANRCEAFRGLFLMLDIVRRVCRTDKIHCHKILRRLLTTIKRNSPWVGDSRLLRYAAKIVCAELPDEGLKSFEQIVTRYYGSRANEACKRAAAQTRSPKPEHPEKAYESAEDAANHCDLDEARRLMGDIEHRVLNIHSEIKVVGYALQCDPKTGIAMIGPAFERAMNLEAMSLAIKLAGWMSKYDPERSKKWLDLALEGLKKSLSKDKNWRLAYHAAIELAPYRPEVALELAGTVPGIFEKHFMSPDALVHLARADPDYMAKKLTSHIKKGDYRLAVKIAGELAFYNEKAARKFFDLIPKENRIKRDWAEREMRNYLFTRRLLNNPEEAAKDLHGLLKDPQVNTRKLAISDACHRAVRVDFDKTLRFTQSLPKGPWKNSCLLALHGNSLRCGRIDLGRMSQFDNPRFLLPRLLEYCAGEVASSGFKIPYPHW